MKSITVPATDNDPNPVIEFVEEELERHNCPEKALYQIEVAIEEILVNIVNYAGLTADDGVEIRCEVLTDPLRVVIQFLDQGVPFDPLSHLGTVGEDPTAGLGIRMAVRSVDDISYERVDGRNVCTITKGW
jgi:anti-sigma regulatory factor (Ser/Thr protein kinase)